MVSALDMSCGRKYFLLEESSNLIYRTYQIVIYDGLGISSAVKHSVYIVKYRSLISLENIYVYLAFPPDQILFCRRMHPLPVRQAQEV